LRVDSATMKSATMCGVVQTPSPLFHLLSFFPTVLFFEA
jgi:hypothetical protein